MASSGICDPSIYAIECLANCKVYIGSTIDPYMRWARHRSLLRHNKHPNSHMQAVWNKYGEESFRYIVLETGVQGDLVEREQEVLDAHILHGGCMNQVTDCARPRAGRKHSPEVIERVASKLRGRKQSPEERKRRGEAIKAAQIRKGIKPCPPHTPEAIKKSADTRRGRKHSEERKRNLSIAGKNMSPEARQRITDGVRAYHAKRKRMREENGEARSL